MPEPRFARIPKAIAALQRKVGDRLLTDKQLTTLGNRGEYVGVGNNALPVKPSSPRLTKLAALFDFKRKGIFSPEVFQSEVQRAGLQPELASVRSVRDTLYNNRGGGEIYSGTMQQSTVLQRVPKGQTPPVRTEVLGDAGISLDSFGINQPKQRGATPFAPTRDLQLNMGLAKGQGFAGDSSVGLGLVRPPGLDSATKAMGYKLQAPQQTGLPWAVAADPTTGEMLTLKGKPLPPLVGPSFPTNSAAPTPIQQSAVSSQQSAVSPFKQGFATSTGTAESPQKQTFFKRTPEQTQGMGLGERLKFVAGRVAGDVASDASRGQYWRYNHPLAIAGHGFEKLAGGNKVGGAVAAFAGIQALGQTSNQFDLTNPGQAFRPKGFSAAYPVNDGDKTQIAPGPLGYIKEGLGRYVFNKGGNLLPYDQFSKERPDVKQEDYQRYSEYLKGGGGTGKLMPDGTVDVGGFGVLKGNINGINGPEARLAGFSVTPLGAAAGTATATGVASIFNKGLRPIAAKGLGVVGAALDFSNRRREGQSITKAATGVGAGLAGGIVGAEGGAALGTALFPGVGTVVGGAIGGLAGYTGAGAVADKLELHKTAPAGVASTLAGLVAGPFVGVAAGAVTQKVTDQLKSANPFQKIQQFFTGQATPQNQSTPSSTTTQPPKYSPTGDQGNAGVSPPDKPWEVVDNGDYPGAKVNRDGQGVITQATDAQGKDITKEVRLAVEERKSKSLHPEDEQGAKGSSKADGVVTNTSKMQVARLQYGAGGTPQERVTAAARLAKAQARRDKANADPNTAPEEVFAAGAAVKDAQSDLDAATPGQGDRNNESKERQTTQTNQTKIATTTQTNQTKIATTDLQGRYGVKREQVKGEYGNQRETIRGQYGTQREMVKGEYGNQREGIKGQYKIADTKEVNKGKVQVATIGYAGKVDAATITSDGKVRTAGVTGEYKVQQEGVKQSGAANVANIRAGATMGAAKTTADGKVNVAQIGLQGTQYKADATVRVADITSSSKAESEGSKAAASFVANLNKSTADSMATEDKARIARYRSLGVY